MRYSLQLPQSVFQLPVQLHDFTWKLLVPKDRLSLALVPAQKLQQHTHERVCNTSFSYLVASAVPGQNLYFGSFCSGGSIEQIQVKENISVTLRTFAPNFQQESAKQDLTVSFIPHFKGKGVFHSFPKRKRCRDPRCSPRGTAACRGPFGGRRKAVRGLALQGGTGDFP